MPIRYVDVILPLPLPQTFTYSVPAELENYVDIGKRAIVQFGARKYYTAVIYKLRENIETTNLQLKEIQAIIDDVPVVNEFQLEFWNWLSEYYMCSIGEIMQAALPAALKLESRTRAIINPSFADYELLSDKEKEIIELLNHYEELEIKDICTKLNQSNILPQLHKLQQKNALYFEEFIEDSFSPRAVKYVRLTDLAADESFLNQIYESLKRSPRQREILETYFRLSGAFEVSGKLKEVKQKILLETAQASYSSFKALIDKKVFEVYYKSPFDTDFHFDINVQLPILTPVQQKALDEIQTQLENKSVVLLHGVTSSGKTEIYFHLIDQVIKQGKQVLYILPEIALTYQMIRRLKQYFGERVGVYHSRITDQERIYIWQKLTSLTEQRFQIILGVRASIFLPFQNLGLVIIDEEHENTFKQFEPAPRYHARDAAIMLSTYFGAKVLLGSATPSVESYFNAQSGKYGLVQITERYGGISLPRIQVVNLSAARKKGNLKSMFSTILLEAIEEALKQKQQIILFQNRRGFAPYLQCTSCQYIFRCRNCDVTLTYHKHPVSLVCHYCGFSIDIPSVCNQCGSSTLQIKGFGTEKIEEELAIFFPEATISRMDMDSTRNKLAYDNIIGSFEKREIDILVGTQMVTKGLDFDNVGLVGILDADSLIHYPDFRSFERSFQLMVQVSGRSGRRENQGKVIIQTYMPDHPIIQQVLTNNYQAMYAQQIAERNQFKYPPFYKLIEIIIKDKDENQCQLAAQQLKSLLEQKISMVLGPEKPIVARIHNLYLRKIVLKLARNIHLLDTKKFIIESVEIVQQNFKSIRIIIDVDPY